MIINSLTIEQYNSICDLQSYRFQRISASIPVIVNLGAAIQFEGLVEIAFLPHIQVFVGNWWFVEEEDGEVMHDGWIRYSFSSSGDSLSLHLQLRMW